MKTMNSRCPPTCSVRRSGEDLGEPARRDEHRESRHERDDLAVRDDDAVDEARADSDGDRDQGHDDPVGLVDEVLHGRKRRDDRGEAHDRADRQVDAAAR